ncbi:MAG: recombinase family protein, partial [Thermoanaerobacteraceae bacterium]|nr:recombinase family protein [Thermoanaerobacteraceae bacterium]
KIPTRKGGDWTDSTIRDILSNPVYIGKIRWNARPQIKRMINGEMVKERPRAEDPIIVDGLHPAIIDEETFYLAQKYLAENPSLPIPTRYKVKNPLAGLIVCGICGRRMNRKPYKSGAHDTLLCTGPTCTNVSSPLYLVEEKLLNVLEDWLKKYKVKIMQQEAQGDNLEIDIIKQSIDNINNELKTLNKQLNSLYDLLEQGIYSTEVFLERSTLLNDKITAAKKDKKELENKLEQISNREEGKKEFIPKVENVINSYWSLKTPKEKNKLLKEVLEKVVYAKEEGGRWSGKVDEFELKLYPKLPK